MSLQRRMDGHRRCISERLVGWFMVLGSSVGIWAALAAKHNISVHEVPEATLHGALEKDRQVLQIPAYIPPVTPHTPSSVRTFACSVGFARCLAVGNCAGSHCHNNSTCDDQCPALRTHQWLALQGSDGGFAINRDGATTTIKALSPKSFLKKSEERSSSLPVTMKRLVAEGTALAIQETSPVMSDGYWMITLLSQ